MEIQNQKIPPIKYVQMIYLARNGLYAAVVAAQKNA
jgi:hypothetical protein